MVLECNNGTFGQHCTELCGNCFQSEPCHHVNGTCRNGCDEGYQEDTCTEGRYMKVWGGKSIAEILIITDRWQF